MARSLVAALIKQLLIDGFFHADPHPGNVVLDPASGHVTFLDLGLMGELRLEQRLDLIALVWSLRMEDPHLLARIVRRLCRATGPVDEAAFRAAIERIYYRTWVYGQGDFGGVMAQLFGVLGEHHLQMRRELVLAVKAITQAEQLVSAIKPGLPLVSVIAEEGQQLVRAQLAAQVAKVRQGEVSDVLMTVVSQASTLGDMFMPRLVEAILGGSRLQPAAAQRRPGTAGATPRSPGPTSGPAARPAGDGHGVGGRGHRGGSHPAGHPAAPVRRARRASISWPSSSPSASPRSWPSWCAIGGIATRPASSTAIRFQPAISAQVWTGVDTRSRRGCANGRRAVPGSLVGPR